MRKAKVTYNAPDGDNKVVEMGGQTFYDGKETELNTDDNGALLDKLQGNQHFDVEMGEEEESPKKRGRPVGSKNRDLKAGIQEAADHDFEADRRNGPQKGQGTDNALGNTGTSSAPKQLTNSAPASSPPSSGTPADQPKAQDTAARAPAEPMKSPLPAAPSPLAEPTKIDQK